MEHNNISSEEQHVSFREALSLEARRRKDAMLDGVAFSAPLEVQKMSMESYREDVLSHHTQLPALHDVAKRCVFSADTKRIDTLRASGVMGLVPFFRPSRGTSPHELVIGTVHLDGSWGELGFVGAYLPSDIVSNIVLLPPKGVDTCTLYMPLVKACDKLCNLVFKQRILGKPTTNISAMVDVFKERLR